MRILLTLFSACFFSLASVAQKPETVIVKTKIYCDHCRQCETCGFVFLKTLPFENGIKKVELDEKTMQLTVLYNPKKTSPEKIRVAISKLGYDADNIPADSVAYEKHDGCCKK
jgi:periplasmic mercuric ion binding protein